ncbi:DEAD/DEAH box helicase family protein [Clostridium sp. MD294]|uniref:DEAD/DEAH box helicase family protein n=1 Tax=Clostridium sp. MD294 TaxID=97138 RepID=UPI0002CA9F4D|nr:DEAD/DEAH box helicase family protein [Clostridium sp. MD294]NDO45363.1 DUF4145 domain-containing protein [Clostridium sp. MD294]USF30996.1 hypothetical protein C820_002442 [Clostridium sp. MD294]
MSNFEFLKQNKQYTLFCTATIEAEEVFYTSPAMCAIGCRKALELAVKWVYSADNTIQKPYRDNLQSLIHEPSFKEALDRNTWQKLPAIIKLGNIAVHTEKKITKSYALLALKTLFEFIQWIDYCYGEYYEERTFDENSIPTKKIFIDTSKIKQQQDILKQQQSLIKKLIEQIEQLSPQLTEGKEQHKKQRKFKANDLSEFETRKRYINVDMMLNGWDFDDDVKEEFQVQDMNDVKGKKGYADYVLFGRDGLPLAVVEAKRSSKDPNTGRQQAVLYANALEKQYGRRPMMFTTNGFDTYFWDDLSYPQRKVSGIFSKNDLQKLMNHREQRKSLKDIKIDDKITDRYYQKEAIRAVCSNIERGQRKHLLVMATGSGKTRTASSLTDVLSRGGYITNVLFLADRIGLVEQAKDDFKNYLPDMSLCNLLSNKEDKNARIVFSTYPTILNAIDTAKNDDGKRFFTPAHFDLIIVDEAHRSIFKKYGVIFDYFDCLVVGLTATPKTDVDRNTYEFFEMENGVPTYAYDYETAVYKDHVLVPYYNIETQTKFLEEGIYYDDLSPEDKQRYEDDFVEDDGKVPEFISSEELNQFIFNEKTIDMVLQDLMTNGIKTNGGDTIGKTIIFAQNKNHAEFILNRFDKLYTQYKGTFAKRITCEDSYAQSIIKEFKIENKLPYIAISVDMMDTGIDVPEVVNLVFFKKVRSKTKFWQMIGRGTRLCKYKTFLDKQDGEYTDKRRFYIFDYCGNFEYFRQHKEGIESKETKTLSEKIFIKRIQIIKNLQQAIYTDEKYQLFRNELIHIVVSQIQQLNRELISVKMKLKYIEKFSDIKNFEHIKELDEYDMMQNIAPLVTMNDTDEYAKRFDNLMYSIILAIMENTSEIKRGKKQLFSITDELKKRTSIPKIKNSISSINTVYADELWNSNDILKFENLRIELRELIKFIVDKGSEQKKIITNLEDIVISRKEGDMLDPAYDFEDYRLKVNRYIEENKNHLAIWKLRQNMRLDTGDYEALKNIFTKELGNEEDYKREFGETPFGLLIRKVAKLDYDAAMKAFSEFINDASLNHEQIVFINKIIDYVVQNGYMESAVELMKPPFDKPINFMKLFDNNKKERIVKLVNEIKENAVQVI